MKTSAKTAAFILCALLLATNVAGLFSGASRQASARADRALRSIDAAYGTLGYGAAFLTEANRRYAEAVRYVWGDEWRHLSRPSWWDSYLIYLLAKAETLTAALLPQGAWTERFRHYESRHFARALGRGFGICSQNAAGLSDLLTVRYGIDTRLVGLDGHVVLQARTPSGRFILLDPSIGIAFDFDAAAAPSRLDEIDRAYRAIDPHLSTIARTFDAAGNRTTTGSHGARDQWPAMYLAETALEWMKWALPAVLLLANLFRPRRRRRLP